MGTIVTAVCYSIMAVGIGIGVVAGAKDSQKKQEPPPDPPAIVETVDAAQ